MDGFIDKKQLKDQSNNIARIIEQMDHAAADIGLDVKLIGMPLTSDDGSSTNKKRHDVLSAFRTLRIFREHLADGYRFDDDAAPEKVNAVQKAIQNLEMAEDIVVKLLA